MDGTAAIEHNFQALKRIVATIAAMAGLTDGRSAIGSRQLGPAHAANDPTAPDCLLPTADCRLTLPRRLRLAVLSLLRPAESAARRLIIAMARGVAVTLPPPRPRKVKHEAKVSPTIVRTGIVLLFGAAHPAVPAHLIAPANHRPLAFPLLDPPRRWRGVRRRSADLGIPRIGVPGITARLAVPKPSAPDDLVDAAGLLRRLEALASALDDLPGQVRRFARWRARRERSIAQGLGLRRSPLRSGRPPGGRLSRYDPSAVRSRRIREVDAVLAHAHALAVYALERHDTS